jgi:hypothetical protein
MLVQRLFALHKHLNENKAVLVKMEQHDHQPQEKV